ncbi:MAG: putative baseplate assembly protein [Nostoc sp. DedQUE04]|uniref:putative baseplate assembly protein n=1 Tax=Nostoc sp. DedQUE04 TaxID=3075390 RepID=UPI002AD2ED98|nr:putative baseplate assembly protein [Nostoc sp. DedQUE04]MDZ8140840.1 putative baseplate assembly protein [Nostoc sp. DedQUE04]
MNNSLYSRDMPRLYTCQNEKRRHEVRRQGRNGLDYLEVGDDLRSLHVYFLSTVPENLIEDNVQIEGGQRIRNLQVTSLQVECPEDSEAYLKINLNQPGDFSTYTLRLVALDEQAKPTQHPDFDQRYAQLQFRFRSGNCSSDLDCLQQETCPPPQLVEPNINYLAKDYASFRQLILDRLSLTMPDWQERHVPDIGITIVEILAYVGDYLSYYQDAVSTEAYLDTARQRISVRRHVRLIDYPMHEGCNARTWLWIETNFDVPLVDEKNFYFITSYQDAPPSGTILKADEHLKDVPPNTYQVFEPLTPAPIQLYVAHNQISFYTWGEGDCCLVHGSTSATLVDGFLPYIEVEKSSNCECAEPQRKLHLKVGDILIFEEIISPKTGNPEDADVTRRHAVRLTSVKPSVDELYNQPIVEIEWEKEDALPFTLCISANILSGCTLVENISVARGNVILVDYGRTIDKEYLGMVQALEVRQKCQESGEPVDILVVPELFCPILKETPLTFSQPLSKKNLTQDPASSLLTQDPRQALPQIHLNSNLVTYDTVHHYTWTAQQDLIDSGGEDKDFIVEMDNDGEPHLRFGDGELGFLPEVGTQFMATYRVGNGLSSNLGADAISYIVFRNVTFNQLKLKIHQPLPAIGGTPPEPISQVKLLAPRLFERKLERAITKDDYAQLVMQDFSTKVQRATATFRWMGSWYEVLVMIDPLHQDEADDTLLQEITAHLNLYRRIGHHVIVKQATRVPLDISMKISVKSDYLRGHIKLALLETFSNRIFPDGRCGFFHPNNLTFGKGIALSQLVAIAYAIPGVESVSVTKLERLFEGANGEIEAGFLSIGSLEIARLDNDPNFPENGKFSLDIRGGR